MGTKRAAHRSQPEISLQQNRMPLNRPDRFRLIRPTSLGRLFILLCLICLAPYASSSHASPYLPFLGVDPLYKTGRHQSVVQLVARDLDQSVVSSYNIVISNKLRNSQQQLTKQQTNFSHLALDTRTDQLYIGATNYLLKFDSNLRLLAKFKTGPVEDSPQCSPTDCFSIDSKEIKPTNNFNKLLLVEPVQRQLIACGSVKQGACYELPLDEDEQTARPRSSKLANDFVLSETSLIKVPVAANDENSSSIAFIGPANYGHEKARAMYVAVTNTKLGNYRELVPALSARSIASADPFRIIESSFTDTARVDISSHLRDYYLVHYVYGFHHHDQIYFAQVQKRSHLRTQEELGYHTRLSRICASDAGFQSYTEITLECQVTGESRTINYNVLRAATLAKVGSNLADGLGLRSKAMNSAGNEVLLGAFSLAKDHSSRHGDHSAICAFSMSDIERRFKENIHLCYNGSIRSRNMDYIAGSVNDCPEPGVSRFFFCFFFFLVRSSYQTIAVEKFKCLESKTMEIINFNCALNGAVKYEVPVALNEPVFSRLNSAVYEQCCLSSALGKEPQCELHADSGQPVCGRFVGATRSFCAVLEELFKL